MLTNLPIDLPFTPDFGVLLDPNAPADQRLGQLEEQVAKLREEHRRLMEAIKSIFDNLNGEGVLQIADATIDGSPIGATKASTGIFTTLGIGVTPSYKLAGSTGFTWAAQVVANNAAETHVVGIRAPTDGASPLRCDITFGTTIGSGGSDSYIDFNTNRYGVAYARRARIDKDGNVVIGTAALSTAATDGFLYIPTCAGAPSGVPTAYTGSVPLVYDSTNNKLYAYNGAWKSATFT